MIACSPGQMLSLWKPLRKEQEAGVLQKPIIAYGKRAPWMVGARLQGGKWTTANPGARIPLCPQLLGPVECQAPPELLPLGTCATGMWGLAACRELILGHIRGDAQHSWKLCPPRANNKPGLGYKQQVTPQFLTLQCIIGAVAFTGPLSQNFVPWSSFQ